MSVYEAVYRQDEKNGRGRRGSGSLVAAFLRPEGVIWCVSIL